MSRLDDCAGWVFDLDGTLTVHQHDFDAIRVELAIPAGRFILEYLDELAERDPQRAADTHARLAAIEQALTAAAVAAPGAHELLATLVARGADLGILTRNTRANALATLATIGLDRYFSADSVLGRDEASPKPAPDGIQHFLVRWQRPAAQCVMIGDYQLDLAAGRHAGVTTVHVHADHALSWPALTDIRVQSLRELVALLR